MVRLSWVVGISLIFTATMAGFDFAQTTDIVVVTVPIWVARAFWVIGALFTFFVASFLVFHKARIERDEAKRGLDRHLDGTENASSNRTPLDDIEQLIEEGQRLHGLSVSPNGMSSPSIATKSWKNRTGEYLLSNFGRDYSTRWVYGVDHGWTISGVLGNARTEHDISVGLELLKEWRDELRRATP